MSRVDENGTVHPTVNDAFDLEAALHIAFCKECSPYALPEPEKPKEKEVNGL